MSFSIENIKEAIRLKKIKVTDHAFEEMQNDRLKLEDVYISVLNGEIIEFYAKDRPYPSCLIFGKNFLGEPIHSVWAYYEKTGWSILITVYRPEPERWINSKIRRK